MKKICILIFVVLSIFPLYAIDLVSDASVEDSLVVEIRKYIEKNLVSLMNGDLTVKISEYEQRNDVEFLTLEFNDKTYDIVFDDDLSTALDKTFKYDFFKTEGKALDYIYGSSFSSISTFNVRRGDMFTLVAPSGKNVGLLAVDEVLDTSVVLSPFYLENRYTGLELKEKLGLKLNLNFRMNPFNYRDFAFDLGFKWYSLLYPFNPMINLCLDIKDLNTGFKLGLGFEYLINFSSLFDSSFTLLEDGNLGSNVFIDLGYLNGFIYGVSFSIFYEYYFNTYSSINIAYKAEFDSFYRHYISLGYGIIL